MPDSKVRKPRRQVAEWNQGLSVLEI